VRALVVGATGQLGRALVAGLGSELAWAGGSAELDVRDAGAVAERIGAVRPDVVFNASAWNDVDGAETRAAECFAVNAAGPHHLARAARSAGARLVHVSTDYVFDGAASQPYDEDDVARPLSVYGAAKLAGELLVAASGAEHLVVRTSAVFGAGGSRAKGGSFPERILARARSGQPLRVVDDQVVCPTFAPDLAEALVILAARGVAGRLHVVNEGSCSWHEFAVATLELAGLGAVPVARLGSAQLAAAAQRPARSVLSTARYAALGLPPLRPWRAALAAHLATARGV